MVHGRLARFASDDSGVFVFARLRNNPDAPLVYLQDGTAKERRAFARAELVCPFPDCESPELTTVSREAGGRRDGYRHLRRSTNHEREGWFHLLAKAAIVHWAASHPAIATAEQEVRLGDRIADVLLTGHHGHRIAVEIQYAALRLEHLRERTASYRAMGIAPVWLWGHVGTHGTGHDSARLRDVHRDILAMGLPLMWIDPTSELLAWGASPGPWVNGEPHRTPDPQSRDVALVITALNEHLAVTPSGIYPPGWHDAAERTKRHLEAVRAAEEAERIANEEKERERRNRFKSLVDNSQTRRLVEANDSWEFWQARTPMKEGALCDVCKHPVLPGQARTKRRHKECNYYM